MSSGLLKSENGYAFDIPLYVDRLMRSEDQNAFLIINVADSDDFLQLTGGTVGVQLDFPLVTSRQQNSEPRIREVATQERLAVVENYGSNGALFLDIDIEGTPQRIAAICSKVLREVFHIAGTSALTFQHTGLADDVAADRHV